MFADLETLKKFRSCVKIHYDQFFNGSSFIYSYIHSKVGYFFFLKFILLESLVIYRLHFFKLGDSIMLRITEGFE